MQPLDLIVVGGGIVGLAIAREFVSRHPGCSATVLEREAELGTHQTGHNSGVIHSGIYYEPGSLKARLCTEGARAMYEYCEQHGIRAARSGKIILAVERPELPRLDELEQRGRANGVSGLRRLETLEEIREIEPHAAGIAALYSPNTGVVDYAEVARTMGAELRKQGVGVTLEAEVRSIRPGVATATVTMASGETLHARRVVVCAGLWADRIARRGGAPADPRIVPFRGAYLHVRPEARDRVRSMIYPVPDPSLPFLGVHLTRHVDGSVSLGPTAMLVPSRDSYRLRTVRPRDVWDTIAWPGTWAVARRYWRVGLDELRMATRRAALVASAARYVPSLTLADIEPAGHAGVRAQAVSRRGVLVDDFVVSTIGSVSYLRNAPSPAATASLAIGREVVDRIERG